MRTVLALALLAACGGSNSSGGGDGGGGSDAHVDARGIDSPAGSDGSVSDTPLDSPVCGLRQHMTGLTHRTVTIGGLTRTYLVYLPASADPATPVPLVLVFHGYTMSGQNMYDITQYQTIADSEHVALAFPDGQGGPNSFGAPWNVGDNVCPVVTGQPPDATGDDFAFMDAMEADIEADQCVDAQHVFVTGFSMGGYFTHHAGCMRPDIAGVAPHSGGTHDLSACPSVHKPIIIFHGKADPVVPPGCDDPASPMSGSAQPSADAWAQHNGCGTTTHAVSVEQGTCLYYDGCPADGQVALCTFDNMGHCWAGGPASEGLYACPGYESATQLEWTFWKMYAW
ncbi:MAG TPA: PHB depolymerase family esterase [Kofleriaceae bacterium]|jgi:poly(3-hydroxybutyrate) depolymerase